MILPVPKLMWRKNVIISTYKYDSDTRPPYFSIKACQSKHLANYSISYHITQPSKSKPVNRDKTKISSKKQLNFTHFKGQYTVTYISTYMSIGSLVLVVMRVYELKSKLYSLVHSPEYKCKVQLLSLFSLGNFY